ncbi:MAG TPA: helix-turn-helix domain-containing protein [Candidatus Acidoferrales bacterium]|nr:helix-turn-helix domain-containing protein [Candidatus Acidoferrales bacterium]
MAGTHKAEKISGFCPRFHRAVELIGRRWTGAIVRALMAGRSRFNEIALEVPGVSSRLLSERLRELEHCGIVTRSVDPGPPVRVAYALTKSGTELDATVRALAGWAERWVPAEQNGRRPRRNKRP